MFFSALKGKSLYESVVKFIFQLSKPAGSLFPEPAYKAIPSLYLCTDCLMCLGVKCLIEYQRRQRYRSRL